LPTTSGYHGSSLSASVPLPTTSPASSRRRSRTPALVRHPSRSSSRAFLGSGSPSLTCTRP
jgi:hypothetical protein